MADFDSAWALGIAAMDELATWQGQPTLTALLAATGTGITQAQLDAANALAAARRTVIDGMVADTQAAAAADAAEDAPETAGDAARAAALAKGAAAP